MELYICYIFYIYLPDRLSGLAFVGETCHSDGGGELPEALRRRVEGGVPIVNGT